MIKNKTDLFSAALLMLLGVGLVTGSLQYGTGTLARMGPGYFPLLLGALLILIGAILVATPPHIEGDEEVIDQSYSVIRPWSCVVAGMIGFIVLGTYGGLVPATFLLIFLSALGDSRNTVKAALALAAGVTLAAVIIFYYGMQMQFPLFTWG